MLDDTADFDTPKVFTPKSCLSRELEEEFYRKNMLTAKSRKKGKECPAKQLGCIPVNHHAYSQLTVYSVSASGRDCCRVR